jgi:hypothetical protein
VGEFDVVSGGQVKPPVDVEYTHAEGRMAGGDGRTSQNEFATGMARMLAIDICANTGVRSIGVGDDRGAADDSQPTLSEAVTIPIPSEMTVRGGICVGEGSWK